MKNEEFTEFIREYSENIGTIPYEELENNITEKEVKSAIAKLKHNKACGLDGLYN